MTLKSKAGKIALTSGMIGATTLANIGLSSMAEVPMIVVIPLSVAGGAIGARQLLKELKEESKKKKKTKELGNLI